MGDDRRIAWLLTPQGVAGGMGATSACLSIAAEAGFRAVAVHRAMATAAGMPELEAEATRLRMQCILVNETGHHRLGASLGDAERWSAARSLSRDGFEGLILCEGSGCAAQAASLLATARALLRDLDQLDWEAYQ